MGKDSNQRNMEIVKITEESIFNAGKIHSESWKESHREFCTEEFIASHTVETQIKYIRSGIAQGKDFYMLVDHKPVGIVSVWNDLIENLYVLPGEQRKGYGTQLLQYVLKQCNSVPTLWILSNNKRANAFYKKHGFVESGRRKQLRNDLFELEMTRGTNNDF